MPSRSPNALTPALPSAAALTVPVSRRGSCTVVEPTGEIDHGTAHVFDEALRRSATTATDTVVVDLTSTSFLACCGIGSIVVLRRDLEAAGRRLIVTGARGIVRRALQVCELRPIVDTSTPRGRPAEHACR